MAISRSRQMINLSLFATGAIASISGVVIQIVYHLGSSAQIARVNRDVLGLNYIDWCVMHKASIVIFALLCIYHVYLHRKFYKAVLAKRSLRKKNRQVLLLSLIFIASALTGLTPWVLDLCGADCSLRKAFVEVHDKVSLLLVLFLVLHVTKRFKKIFLFASR